MIVTPRTKPWICSILSLAIAVQANATVFMPPAIVLVFAPGEKMVTDDMTRQLAEFENTIEKFGRETHPDEASYQDKVIICAQDESGSRQAMGSATKRAKLVLRKLRQLGLKHVAIVSPAKCGEGWAGTAAVQIQAAPF
jgi:hypothetical protein